MVRITKHGKFNEFKSTECPECGCCFEYTQEYIDRNNGNLKCPECLHTIVAADKDTQLKIITNYKRDCTKEYEAIENCIESIDFEALAKACKFLAENIDDFDYLADKTENNLRQTAKQELVRSFEEMEKHGYTINYRNNEIAVSYCFEGVFDVDTFYDPVKDEYWCTCNYGLFNGTSF
jgi:predicted Zn finger-like uncharacterized protein